MLRAIGWLLKIAVFSVVILILGNYLRWPSSGRTISDEVRTHLAHAEQSAVAGHVREWAGQVTEDARKEIQEKIPPSERQKLNTLIRELNGSQGHGK